MHAALKSWSKYTTVHYFWLFEYQTSLIFRSPLYLKNQILGQVFEGHVSLRPDWGVQVFTEGPSLRQIPSQPHKHAGTNHSQLHKFCRFQNSVVSSLWLTMSQKERARKAELHPFLCECVQQKCSWEWPFDLFTCQIVLTEYRVHHTQHTTTSRWLGKKFRINACYSSMTYNL